MIVETNIKSIITGIKVNYATLESMVIRMSLKLRNIFDNTFDNTFE